MSYDARSEAVALMTAMGYSRYQEVTVKRIAEALQRAFSAGLAAGLERAEEPVAGAATLDEQMCTRETSPQRHRLRERAYPGDAGLGDLATDSRALPLRDVTVGRLRTNVAMQPARRIISDAADQRQTARPERTHDASVQVGHACAHQRSGHHGSDVGRSPLHVPRRLRATDSGVVGRRAVSAHDAQRTAPEAANDVELRAERR